jgi:hypothetical protein
VEDIARLCHHIDLQNVTLNPVCTYFAELDPTTSHSNFSGNSRTPTTPGVQPTGYRNFLFLTTSEFEYTKTHHTDLNNRLRTL